ncbi:AMP-binding protein, partial [Pseudomonas syringae pv. tagetis]|uniref:AMP-binding protein n=1 Tax=Pseudomonas syringae group genomosp. 7 TaxID=251699 RepID=UPI00376F82CF
TIDDKVKNLVPAFHLPQAVGFKRAIRLGRDSRMEAVPRGLYDVAVLQYTGGTPGLAKGAKLTHGNLNANMQQVYASMRQQ